MTPSSRAAREAPAWFRAELRRRFGEGHDCEWDAVIQRWVIVSPSAAGYPTRQVVHWTRDPATGRDLRPNAFGLLPFKELTDDVMLEILRNMEQTALTNPHDGAQTWTRQIETVASYNEALLDQARREGVRNWTLALQEADLRRPWLKHHSRNPVERAIAWGGRR